MSHAGDHRNNRPDPTRIRTSEGCTSACALCGMSKEPPRVRPRSPEQVIDEIRTCDAEAIILEDCPLAADSLHTERILQAIRGVEDLAGRFRWQAALRPDRLTEGSAEALRALNVEEVILWCLSGSERELKELSGGSLASPIVERALLTCRKFSLPVRAFLFKGAPNTSRSDISDTYEWILQAIKRRLLHAATVDLLRPWPGTPVFEGALTRGIVTRSTTAEEIRQHWQRFYLPKCFPQEELLCYDLLTEPIRKLLEEAKKRTTCVLVARTASPDRDRVARLSRNTYFDDVVVLARELPSKEEQWEVGGHLGKVRILREDEGEPMDVALLEELIGNGSEVIYWLTGEQGPEDAVQALAWDHVTNGSDCTYWLDDKDGKRGIALSPKAVQRLSSSPSAVERQVSTQVLSVKHLAIRRPRAHRNLFLGRPMAERLLHREMERQWGRGLREGPDVTARAVGLDGLAPEEASEAIRLRDVLIRAQHEELLRLAEEVRTMKGSQAPRGQARPKEKEEV